MPRPKPLNLPVPCEYCKQMYVRTRPSRKTRFCGSACASRWQAERVIAGWKPSGRSFIPSKLDTRRNRKYHPLASTWHGILARCTHKKNLVYQHYGGRGIKVLWKNFAEFVADMVEKPPGMSLDRIDNNGHYCKENCRWVTHKEQMRNTRRNRYVEIFGKRMSLAEVIEKYGVTRGTLNWRLDRGDNIYQILGLKFDGPYGGDKDSLS